MSPRSFPDVHPDLPRRHPLVAVVLDRRGRGAGARHPRHPQRAHDDVTGVGRQPAPAARVLHQGHRRVALDVSPVRRRRATGVPRGERVAEASDGAGGGGGEEGPLLWLQPG